MPPSLGEHLGIARVHVVKISEREWDEHPLWGSAGALLSATLQSLLGDRPPPVIRHRMPIELATYLASLRETFDLVWACRSWIAETVRELRTEPIVVDVDYFEGDLLRQEMDRFGYYRRRPFHALQQWHLRRYERTLGRRFAAAAVVTGEDARFMEPSGRTMVVPNGLDFPEAPLRSPMKGRLLFVGSFSHQQNLHALTWFVEEVLPQIVLEEPDAHLHVAGRGPVHEGWHFLLGHPNISIIESPPALDLEYSEAQVVVAPIRDGSGTKLKVLEALGFGVPVVATSLAVVGLALKPGAEYFEANEPLDFSRQCVEALRNGESVGLVGPAGRAAVSGLHWEGIANALAERLEEIGRTWPRDTPVG